MVKKDPIDPSKISADKVSSESTAKVDSLPVSGGNDLLNPSSKNLSDIKAKIFEDNTSELVGSMNQTSQQPPVMPHDLPIQDQPVANDFNNQFQQSAPNLMPQSSTPVTGSAKKVNYMLIAAAVVGLLLLGIGGFSVYKGDLYWMRDLVGMGIPSDAKKALEKANDNTNKLKSFDAKLDFGISGSYNSQDMKVGVSADLALNNAKKQAWTKLALNDISVPETSDSEIKGIKNALNGLEAVVNGSVDQGELYAKYGTSSQWYKLNTDSINGLENFTNFAPSILSDSSEVSSESKLTAAVAYAATSESQVSDITKSLKNIKRLSDEKVDGVASYHYQAELDTSSLASSLGSLSGGLTTKVDYWITKKEIAFKKMALTASLNMDTSSFGGVGAIKFAMDLGLNYKNYNNAKSISIPSGAKDVSAYDFGYQLGQAMSGQQGATTATARNAQRKADVAQLKTALEMYYADNGSYPAETSNSKSSTFLQSLIESKYLAAQVKDPSDPSYYYSYTSTDGKSYTMTYVNETASGITVEKVTN